jgi:hypothetical protein
MQNLPDHIDHQVATIQHAMHNLKMMTLVPAIKKWEAKVSLTELKYSKGYINSHEHFSSLWAILPHRPKTSRK